MPLPEAHLAHCRRRRSRAASEAPRHPEIPRPSCTQDTKAAGTLAVQIHPWSIWPVHHGIQHQRPLEWCAQLPQVGNLHIDLATLWKLPTLEKSCWYILVEDFPAFLHRDEVQQIVLELEPSQGTPSEGKTQLRDTPVKGKPSQGTPSEGKTQSRESAGTQSRDTPVKGKPSQGKVLELEPSQGTTSEGENPVKGKCWNPVKGHSSERKTQSRESVGTGTQSREPSEGKTQSRVSAGTQSRDTQWREITVKGKCGREEKQCFKSLKSLIYRIGEILKCFNF